MALTIPPALRTFDRLNKGHLDADTLTSTSWNRGRAMGEFYAQFSSFVKDASAADFKQGLPAVDESVRRGYLAWKYPALFQAFDNGQGEADSSSPLAPDEFDPASLPAKYRGAAIETPNANDHVLFSGEVAAAGGIGAFINSVKSSITGRDLDVLMSTRFMRSKLNDDLFRSSFEY